MMKKESSKEKRLGKGAEGFFSTFPNYILVSIIIIISLSIILLMPVKVLIAQDYKSGEYLKSWRVKNGEHFTVEYIHSVQLTPVTETYTVDNMDIILNETTFESYGAGLPSTTPYTFEITESGFRIFDINEIMDYLVYRTGAERANHKLIYKNKDYQFLSFSKPRTGVQFKIKSMRFFAYVTREGFN